jgi:MFS family permease
VVNWVSGVLAIGMMGIFLPFTIYLQSVLGFSALKAGLTMAPASLVSMFVAPVAGRMTDKIGGKFGAGQNGGISKQAGLPASLVAEVGRIGHDVFTFGYVDAMRTTMAMPVILLLVGAASCLAIRGRRRSAEPVPAAAADAVAAQQAAT